MRAILITIFLSLVATTAFAGPTPYAGQEARTIKALSDQEISDYLAGKGMGLAKAAELNGYPGPAHVLENSHALNLTPDQEAATQALFHQMQQKAAQLGMQLIDEERKLDQLFASSAITSQTLAATLAAIGQLQAQIRQTHLETHLAQVLILNSGQVARYKLLRGYASDTPERQLQHSHEHH
jgi:hypothetical protein